MTDIHLCSLAEIVDELSRRYPTIAVGVISYEGVAHGTMGHTTTRIKARSHAEAMGLAECLHEVAKLTYRSALQQAPPIQG